MDPSCKAAGATVSWHKRTVSGKCFHETRSVTFKSAVVPILIIPALLPAFSTKINHEVEEKARLQPPATKADPTTMLPSAPYGTV